VRLRGRRRVAMAAPALAVLLLGALALVGLDPAALSVLPALALCLLLALRRYPGERVLLGLARVARARRRRSEARQLAPRGPIARPRGGLLLACSLAVRPPPAALAAS
jgi:hypothetical protein